jgi:hypothetical protein
MMQVLVGTLKSEFEARMKPFRFLKYFTEKSQDSSPQFVVREINDLRKAGFEDQDGRP